ncbi:hypothetical protein LTR36_002789 [Oleoguttula mirabilis]|uniref:F-box domain-containing protein n=1 Tax=Oleoguttula mirabilis TaxID=1507867 RepID=A0AAV9JJL7_9PEZI|nr:hypothetical protein LTR36_002789 [Oleoguttula mirabilis]
MAIAANRVYDTTELLESILLYLPLHDSLLAQRVGGKFRDLVRTSHNCRKALFLEPLKLPTAAEVAATASQDRSPSLPGQQPMAMREAVPAGLPTAIPINPLLNKLVEYEETQCVEVPHRLAYHRTFVSLALSEVGIKQFQATPVGASWRRTLVIPPHAVPLCVMSGYSHEPGCERSLMEGLTMGELVEMEVRYQDERAVAFPVSRGRDTLAVGLMTGLSFTVRGKDIRRVVYGQHNRTVGEVCGWDILALR